MCFSSELFCFFYLALLGELFDRIERVARRQIGRPVRVKVHRARRIAVVVDEQVHHHRGGVRLEMTMYAPVAFLSRII